MKRVTGHLDDEHENMWNQLLTHYEGMTESHIVRTLIKRKFYAIQDGDTTEERLRRIEEAVNEVRSELESMKNPQTVDLSWADKDDENGDCCRHDYE